jgi:Flp pilus assembly protein TadD/glutathione synthase/RimK-type ligase-like ATP-grasp enzyme
MTSVSPKGREQALALHRIGRLDAARSAYEALLEATPENADLLGLLGVVALQQGRPAEAEQALHHSLAAGGDARIRLRNLNNLLAMLLKEGRRSEARKLAAGEVPDWPADAPAAEAERATVLSLAEALLGCGEVAKARRLLERALPNRTGDAEALGLDGRLQLEEGDTAGAVRTLSQAKELAPDDFQTLVALSCAQDRLGQRAAARATNRHIGRRWPIYSSTARPGQRATILVLNQLRSRLRTATARLREVHFGANFPSEFASAMAGEYRFLSLLGDLLPQDLPGELPRADIVLNNIASAERLNAPGEIDTVRSTVDRLGLPVINHPDLVFRTTRQKNALLLEGIPGLRIPRIERYRVVNHAIGQIAADIEERFSYPVILRRTVAHMSAVLQHSETRRPAVLVCDGTALREHLSKRGRSEIYAIEYIDLKKKEGYFRKIRAVIADGEVIVAIPSLYRTWMVSSARSSDYGIEFYRSNPDSVELARRIALDPKGMLGAACMRTLEAIRDRIPLDIFGVDFDVDDEGRVVLFEANAAMNFLKHLGEPDDVTLPDEPFERIQAAIHRMVARRIGAG